MATTSPTLPQIGSPLTESDLQALAASGISHPVVDRAGWHRVTHAEACQAGIKYRSDHLEGLLIPYRDPRDESRIVAYRVRRDHPEVDSDGKPTGKYLSSKDRRHLYFRPDAAAYLSDTSVPCLLVEAEKSVLAIVTAEDSAHRRHLLIGTGGCWGWRGVIGKTTSPDGTRVDQKGPLPDLDLVTWTNRDTIIVFDANVTTNDKVQAARRKLAEELERRGARVRVVDLPIGAGISGPDDFIGRNGGPTFFALVDAAQPLSKPGRKSEKEKPKQGRGVDFVEVDPWPEPVAGDVLLTGIAATFTRYLSLPTHAASAIALWVLHAVTFEAWFTSPILAITSPAPRCGKTMVLVVLGALVPRKLFAANVTPAVLFRTIEKYSPSLLIDEADTFVKDNDELRGVINSGHTRTTALVIRTVGEDHDPRVFSTWSPKAIAMIGKLPQTLHDRAIEIRMRRRLPGEQVARLRQDRIVAECEHLRRQAARWANDHTPALSAADPDVPELLNDRAADSWRPLLAIADAAGGEWPRLARAAAEGLSGAADQDTDIATMLLTDIKTIFDGTHDAVIGSSTIIETLVELEDRPWKEYSHGRPLTPAKLAHMLKGYAIVPAGTIRIGAKTVKGYRRAAFEDAWGRYLTPEQADRDAIPPAKASHRNTTNKSGDLLPIQSVTTPIRCDALKSVTNPINTEPCDGVTASEPLKGNTDDRQEGFDV